MVLLIYTASTADNSYLSDPFTMTTNKDNTLSFTISWKLPFPLNITYTNIIIGDGGDESNFCSDYIYGIHPKKSQQCTSTNQIALFGSSYMLQWFNSENIWTTVFLNPN